VGGLAWDGHRRGLTVAEMRRQPEMRVFSAYATFLIAVLGVTVASCAKPAAVPSRLVATIVTDRGAIVIELLPKVAPKAVENFRLLAQRGYYNGLTFHRVVKGFMIQGGDPKGDGSGGTSAWGQPFADEIERHSPLYQTGYKRGSVAMANTGPNTNRSQFFIVQQDYVLPPSYTIFGKVVRGMDVVDAIAALPTTLGADGMQSRPIAPPVMKSVSVRTDVAPPAAP